MNPFQNLVRDLLSYCAAEKRQSFYGSEPPALKKRPLYDLPEREKKKYQLPSPQKLKTPKKELIPAPVPIPEKLPESPKKFFLEKLPLLPLRSFEHQRSLLAKEAPHIKMIDQPRFDFVYVLCEEKTPLLIKLTQAIDQRLAPALLATLSQWNPNCARLVIGVEDLLSQLPPHSVPTLPLKELSVYSHAEPKAELWKRLMSLLLPSSS